MWLIAAGVAMFVAALALIRRQDNDEPIAQPKESEPIVHDACNELNYLEAKILKDANGMSIPNSEWNQEIFARQTKIVNNYDQAGITIDMDIETQRWKVRK